MSEVKPMSGVWENKRRIDESQRISAGPPREMSTGHAINVMGRVGRIAIAALEHAEEAEAERDALLEALRKIAKGEGRFSGDRLTHAENTIEDMKRIAAEATPCGDPGGAMTTGRGVIDER